ncbi:MAG TPA: YbhN family protein, partial [Acidimicrobiales bacterium]|nr:YbhN family protein [Acidimicrobiales bacterium]
AKSGESRPTAARLLVAFRRSWPYLRYVVGLALAWFALETLNGHRGELSDAEGYLTHLHWQWVILAALCEAASLFSFAVLQRRLLEAGQVRVGLGSLSGITLAATSIADSLPLGPALASVFAYRQYRRKGATQALAGWVVAASLVVAVVTLAVLASFGLAVAGAEGASFDLVWVTVGVLILALALSVVFLKKRFLAHAVSASVRLCRRLTGRPRGEVGEQIDRIVQQLTVVQLNGRQATGVAGWGMANWALDCACLACAFAAVGVAVPWRGLILAYGAGQLAANLPITPGGLGVVEGSLTIALVAYGGSEASTVAAVLLYRIFNFWIVLPVGWVAWLTMLVRQRRELRRSPPAPPDAGTPASPPERSRPSGSPKLAAAPDPAPPVIRDPTQALAGDAGAGAGKVPGRPGRRRRLVVVLAGAVIGSVALTSCTGGHATLGTGSSACYLALPKAADAVHHRGTLVGVHLASPAELDSRPTTHLELEGRNHGPLHNACLVEYRGMFSSSTVERPLHPGRTGTYAIAVLDPSGQRLLATFVLKHAPVRFGHPRIGT